MQPRAVRAPTGLTALPRPLYDGQGNWIKTAGNPAAPIDYFDEDRNASVVLDCQQHYTKLHSSQIGDPTVDLYCPNPICQKRQGTKK